MERSKAAKREGRRQEDLTVALKGSAIMQKCFLPVAKQECHSVLQCACDSLHDTETNHSTEGYHVQEVTHDRKRTGLFLSMGKAGQWLSH